MAAETDIQTTNDRASGHSLDRLVGAKVKVPRIANPSRCWWVKVLEQRGAFIRVGGNRNAGAPWWMDAKDVLHVSRPNTGLGPVR